MKKNFLVGLSLLFLVVFYFWGIWNTYFAQDEWNGFGLVIALLHKPFWSWFDMVTSLHFIPLTSLGWLIMYKIFGYQASFYAVTSIMLHAIASFLVYILSYKLSKNRSVGILTAVLFATNSRARAAVTYLGVFSNTIPFFILIISFFIYLLHISKKSIFTIQEAVILLGIFFAAVLFREDGVILIPLLITFLVFFNRASLNHKNIPFFAIFYGGAFSYFLYRISLQLKNPNADLITGNQFFNTFLYNVFTFPFKLVVQNILDGYYSIQLFLLKNTSLFFRIGLQQDLINTFLFDLTILVIFILLTVAFWILSRKIKDKIFWKNVFFCITIIIFNSVILATIGRKMERIEERYLYLSGFAVVFIVSLLFYHLYTAGSKNVEINSLKKASIILLILIVFLAPSYVRIQDEITSFTKVGKVRKQIIDNIVNLHPTIAGKTIFYVECKKVCLRNSEFGLANELVLPFSSGPGWIILLQYAKDNEEKYYKFFTYHGKEEIVWDWRVGKFAKVNVKEFLWDMGASGYAEKGSYGFGYFIDKDLLRDALKNNHLSKSVVIGLEYDERNFSIKDISAKVQNEL